MDIVILALIAGTGIVFSLFKLFDYRWVLKCEFLIDFVCTGCLPWLFFGTFSGMTLAVLTGIVVSVELLAIRKILEKVIGYEKGKPKIFQDIKNNLKRRVGSFRYRGRRGNPIPPGPCVDI